MGSFLNDMKSFVAPLGLLWPIVFVPIWQELLFRYFPYRFLYQPPGNFWLIGIITSLIFASIHWYFKSWFIVFAFFSGIFLWWVMVRYSLIAAILVHALINS